MAHGNPAIREAIFEKYSSSSRTEIMTFEGTLNKTLILFVALALVAAGTWMILPALTQVAIYGLLIGCVIGGLVLALVTAFKPETSPYTAIPYAVVEGVVIGILSAIMEAAYPGIVLQAVGLTFGVFFLMLVLYRTRVIRASKGLIIGIMVATGAIALVYIIDLVLMAFGKNVPFIHDSGPIGIIFSLVVVGIAAFNFIIDFHVIEQGVSKRAAKWMEWYGSWALIVTLVWLYIELLRLLSKLRSND